MTHDPKWISAGFSAAGARRVLASEKRLRRLAARLGLRAEKRRSELGGWQIVDGSQVMFGPGRTIDEAGEFLQSREVRL